MRTIYVLAAGLVAIAVPLQAEESARVTDAVNIVEHGTKDAVTTPATKGTAVRDGEYLKTGALSRAELLLPSTSITRLGANTIFTYSAETNSIDLQAGTVLFCKPKDAAQLNVRTTAVTAAVLGTTGFVSVKGAGKNKVFRIGIIEGHTKAQAQGHTFNLGAGDILEIRPGERPFVFAYDVARFVASSPLLHDFPDALPNQKYIQAEVDHYNTLSHQGYVGPGSNPNTPGQGPFVSPPAIDSAHNSQIPPNPPPKPSQYPQ